MSNESANVYKGNGEWRRLIAEYGPPLGGARGRLTFDDLIAAIAERRALHFERSGSAFTGSDMHVRFAVEGDSTSACLAFARPCVLTHEIVNLLNRNSWETWNDVPWMVYPELTGEDALRAARAEAAEKNKR
jgi:hypothetical protein